MSLKESLEIINKCNECKDGKAEAESNEFRECSSQEMSLKW